MPTTYTDQFFVMDPGNPPAPGTNLTVQIYDLVDQNNDDLITPANNDLVNGLDVTSVWQDDTITVVMNGATVTITGVTFYVSGGPAVFTPTDGTVLSNAVFQSSTWVTTSTQADVGDLGPPCFVAGTLIRAQYDLQPVETLSVGDLIETKDHGLQPIRWTGKRRVRARGDHAPIRFAAGAMGNARPLLVSPQHRMLISGWKAELYFGQDEVLVPAKHLVDGILVTEQPMPIVTYHHLLFDDHEIIEAEGTQSESFHPGDTILEQDADLRAEILAIFPELASVEGRCDRMTARRVLKGAEARVLTDRPAVAAA